jgi:hypothetical protein
MALPNIAASQQFGRNQTDVFVVGSDGGLYVFGVEGTASNWSSPVPIGTAGTFPPGAAVTASNQFGILGQTDVFAVSNQGELMVASIEEPFLGPPPSWNAPAPIGPTDMFPPGAPVAASQQFGADNQTDVFAVSNEGQLMVAWVNGAGNWVGPAGIGPRRIFPPGAAVAASQQFGIDNQTDVFAVSSLGQLMVAWIYEGGDSPGDWSGPAGIGSVGVFPPGAALAASAQFGVDNQTDVFAVSNEGQLMVAWYDQGGSWNAPAGIGPAFFPPGAPVAASQHFGIDNQTDVFAASTSLQLMAASVQGTGNWNGPTPIEWAVQPGVPVAVSQQFGAANQTDVFTFAVFGELFSFVCQNNNWTPILVGSVP